MPYCAGTYEEFLESCIGNPDWETEDDKEKESFYQICHKLYEQEREMKNYPKGTVFFGEIEVDGDKFEVMTEKLI